MFQYNLTGKDGSGFGFGSWKTVPAVPVPLSVSGKTVPTVPVPVRFLSYLEYFFQFFELSTKAAFAKAAFDTLQWWFFRPTPTESFRVTFCLLYFFVGFQTFRLARHITTLASKLAPQSGQSILRRQKRAVS